MIKLYIDGEEIEMKYDNIFKPNLEEKETKYSKTINVPATASFEELLEILEEQRLEELKEMRNEKITSLLQRSLFVEQKVIEKAEEKKK